MGIFTPDYTAVDAGFPLYDKGMYRIKVTEREPFIYESEDEEDGSVKIVAGIHYKLEMYGLLDEDGEPQENDESGREIRGKSVSRNTVYVHSEGGWSFGKSFLMASCGWAKNEENEANADLFQAGDWTFNGEPGDEADDIELGDSWDLLVDRFVDVYLQKIPSSRFEGEEEQKMSAWTPVGEKVEV